jgi:beta-lactam-binding protein with PASTA domain/tRNA A-37 threonylcarbamoyl transferase component Bud32
MPGSVGNDLPGRVLAGRYLLHGAIGTGASGRVYVADDQRLRRRVAVKVLHAALADDTAFLRRFRAEAQLAASLHHSNIVTVYDWGEDDVPFMVLELLEGGSLRSMLDQNSRLTVAQAARVGRDVASALEYAHARDVLHRDVKPANLLFDEHGIVRVADFGLARALAEASWTEPAGGMLGTARYASPEQAMGLQLDARSDLYALALVLVEAVTGRVPFASDTTIGMLTARTQKPLRAPDELGPLGAVIDRAGGLNPEDRYPDAGTMRQALADVGDSLPPPGALVLAGMHDQADPHPTRVAAAVTVPSPLFDQDATEIALAPPVQLPVRSNKAQHRRLVPLVVGIVLLVTVALAASAFARVSGASTISVPGLVGRTQAEATALAKHEGLSIGTVATQSASDPKGVVTIQSPAAGSFTSGRTVNLVVSTGPKPVEVPEVTGKPWSTVQKQLDDVGFTYGTTFVFSDTVASGDVISVNPQAGKKIAPDAEIAVVLSKGHAPVGIPDLSGQSFKDASDALKALHFTVFRTKDVYNNDIPKGKVWKTNPRSGADAPYGSEVRVTVSRGPILTTVPPLKGLTLSEAQGRLDTAHLEFSINGPVRGGDVVVDQTPSAGAKVPLETTTVELTFGRQDGFP